MSCRVRSSFQDLEAKGGFWMWLGEHADQRYGVLWEFSHGYN